MNRANGSWLAIYVLQIFQKKTSRVALFLFLVTTLLLVFQRSLILSTEERDVEKLFFSEELAIRHRLKNAEAVWEKGQLKRQNAVSDYNALVEDPWSHPHARSFWDFFYANFDCPHVVERVGRLGDGGKWICGFSHLKSKTQTCIVYSFGISTETSFEEEILQQTNCSVLMYDHTTLPSEVKLLKLFPKKALFYKLGLGTDNTSKFRTLKTEMDKHGHKFLDILKIDVEGAEFDALEQIISDFPTGFPFAQLSMEVHLSSLSLVPETSLLKRFNSWWEMLLKSGLRPFHSEVNPFDPFKVSEFSFFNFAVDNSLLHAFSTLR